MVDAFIKFIHINHVLLFRLFVCFFLSFFRFIPTNVLAENEDGSGGWVGWLVGNCITLDAVWRLKSDGPQIPDRLILYASAREKEN